jgi:hypothetical protein
MFCAQCGVNNTDGATFCSQCGGNLQGGAALAQQMGGAILPPGVNVPNYLVFAILATVLCCLPAGIPAIVYAAQVNGKLQAGDIVGAQAASRNAKMWCWISFGLGLAVGLVMLVGTIRQIGSHTS